MGKEFWLGSESGAKYKTPAYGTGGIDQLSGAAKGFGSEWEGKSAAASAAAQQGDYWKDQQRAFGEQLLAASQGKVPSAAELQMKAGLNQATAQGAAMSRSMPGLSPGMAMRAAQTASQGSGMQVAGQAAALRADEMARAQQAYAQFTQGARSGDLQMQQLAQQYMSMGMSAQEAALRAQMELEAQRQQAWATENQINASSVTPGSSGFLANAATGAAEGLTGLISDRREKKDIKKASPEAIEKFADALEGYSYKYKDTAPVGERDKEKTHFGVMAQDLVAGGPIGKSVVNRFKEGAAPAMKAQPARPGKPGREVLSIDTQGALSAALAAIGNLHGRLKALEKE
jgi:hypothetical protein